MLRLYLPPLLLGSVASPEAILTPGVSCSSTRARSRTTPIIQTGLASTQGGLG